jgi:hypothetical protein
MPSKELAMTAASAINALQPWLEQLDWWTGRRWSAMGESRHLPGMHSLASERSMVFSDNSLRKDVRDRSSVSRAILQMLVAITVFMSIPVHAATISGVSSNTANGRYRTGDQISIQVSFSAPVTVTGVPQLTLETGASDAMASYSSGSGTKTLTFLYSIASGHYSSDLDYQSSSALILNGGTILNTATNNAASLTLPTPGSSGSLGANKALIVDTTVISSVSSSTANGRYRAGDQIWIQVLFSAPVTVTGTPQLTLETGTADAVASYSSGSGTNTLTFLYTIAAGNTSGDLDYQSANAIAVAGGTIRSIATSSDTPLTLPAPGVSGSLGANNDLIVDTTAPTASLSLLTPSITNSLPIQVQITFSESVTGFTSSDLSVTNGSVTGLTGSGTSYTASISAAAHGTVTIQIPANAAFDAANNGNTASASLSAQYDTQAPFVTNVTSSPSTGAYRATQSVNVILTFSENVIVSGGTPSISLAGNSPAPSATYLSGSGTTQLTFRYTISSGDTSEDLDYSSASALALNGSTIRDTAGNTGILTLPSPGSSNSLSSNSNVVIDTSLPSVVITSPISGDTALDVIPVTVVFSEAVTGFTLSDFTVSNGCASNLQGSGTTYTADIIPRATGQVLVTVPASAAIDRAGNSNSAASVPVSVNFSTFAPLVTSVTSSTADFAYRAGQQISIQVSFSEAVIVNGTPQLRLATGPVATVDYLSGSGTDTLTFLYTIAAGQNSGDLDYIPLPPLNLNGGQIVDAATQSLEIARTFACPGAAGSLSFNKNIIVDTVTPTIARVSSTTADGSYRAGGMLNVQTQFSETVYVTGTPLLTLETGVNDAVISMVSGSGSPNLNFDYPIVDGHNSNRLDYQSVNAFDLNGSIIQDLAGNIAVVTLPATGSANSLFGQKQLVVDTIPPTVPNVTSTTANGSYKAGAVINVQISLSEVVFVTNSPRIQLATGLPNRFATYVNGSGTSNLNFTYTVTSGDTANDLDYISTSAFNLNGATVRDLAGNDMTPSLAPPGTTFSLSANKNIRLDTTAPTITGVTSSLANGNYPAGTIVPIRISFTEPVHVSGNPFLVLNTTPNQAVANFSSGSGSSVLTFNYTVQSGQNSSDLDYASALALTIPAGSSIRDTALNDTISTLPTPGLAGSLGASSNIVIDTVAPTITQVTSTNADGSYRAESSLSLLVTFSEPVLLTGGLQLTLVSGPTPGQATCSTLASTTSLLCSYTVQSGDATTDLDYQSSMSLSLLGSTSNLSDAAGNGANLTLFEAGAPGSLGASKNIILDTTAPSAVLTSSAPADTNTSPVPLTITFSEPVTGLSLTAFSLTNATIQNLSGSGAVYTAQLIPAAQGTLSVTLGAGAVLDPAGNSNLASNTLSRSYDSIRPTVAISSSLPERSNASSIPIAITFSESVSGFDTTDISVTNGSVTTFSGSGADYTAVIEPSADGEVSISIAQNVAVDVAQNGNQASTTLSRTIDRSTPTVTSVTTTLADGAYGAGTAITIDIAFSEPVQLSGSFTLELTTANGPSLALCSQITTPNTLRCSYTVITGDTSADLDYVSENALGAVAAATLSDLAQNPASLTLPTPGTDSSLSFNHTLAFDTAHPSVTLTSSAPNVTNSSPLHIAVNFSEPVTGVSVSTFTVSNGSIESVTGSDSNYILSVIPTSQGNVSVSVLQNGAFDRAQNGCAASAELIRQFDSIQPTITLEYTSSQIISTDEITIPIEFSESVSGFEADDIVVANGTVQSFTGAGSSYSVRISTRQDGQLRITIPSDVAFDSAGNGNLKSDEFNKTVDTTSPYVISVTATNPDGYYKAGDTLILQVHISEPVTLSGNPTLQLQTGRAGAYASYKSGSGSAILVFKYVVTEGDNSPDLEYANVEALSLQSSSITDLAQHPLDSTLPALGSALSLAASKNIVIDTLSPTTPVILSPKTGEVLNRSKVTISGTTEANASLEVLNGADSPLCSTIANQTGAWSCEVSELDDGSYTVRARAEDIVSNSSLSEGVQFTINTTLPSSPVFTEPVNGVTTESRPRFAGTATPLMIVRVKRDGSDLCAATADSTGVWACSSTVSLQQGRYTVQGITEDPADLAQSLPTSLSLTVGAPFSGIVVMANRTQEPLADVTISDGTISTKTAADGTYSLVTPDPSSPALTALKKGWRISRASSPEVGAAAALEGVRWYATPALDPETYTIWDGSLLPFTPSLRILNRASSAQPISVTLYRADGTECVEKLSASANSFDYTVLPLHSNSCFSTDSFGLVRISYPSNEYDGELTMQRGAGMDTWLTSAFSLPLSNSITGTSYALVDNAYHIERGGRQAYIMRNDLLISNLSSSEKRFTIRRYRSNAALSKAQVVTIPGYGTTKIEFPIEGEESQENGFQEIQPDDPSSPYTAVIMRRGEQQLRPPHKTGNFLFMDYARSGGNQNLFARVQYLPKRFAVQYIEVANVSNVGANVRIARLNKRGRIRPTISIFLKPKETRKVRVSRLLELYQEGIAQISSDVPNSIIVNSIMKHYRGDRKLLSMKSLSIRETFGDSLYGIYQRVGRTRTLLKITNVDTQEVQGSITCYQDSQPLDVQPFSLRPGSQNELMLRKCLADGTRGVVEVNTSRPGSITADTLIFRRRDDVHLPGRFR